MTAPSIVTVTLNPAIDHTITLDELMPGTVHRARSSVRQAGGKGVNVAGCLSDWRRTDEPAIVATGLLGGSNAATFEDFLASKGIVDRFVRVPGHTRNNIKLLDLSSDDTTDVNLPGLTPLPVHMAQLHAVVAAVSAPGAIVVLSGSLPPGVSADGYVPILASLKRAGARVILDTAGPPLREALAGPAEMLPWAIKPNQEELEECVGQSFTDIGQMARAALGLCRRGVGLVVVSRGAEGALYVSERAVLLGRTPVTQIGASVGAGDALVAGLVAALAVSAEPEHVARLSLSFAAAKLTQQGPNLPDRDIVLSLMSRMTIERLPSIV
jgi:1-phosphofructokinase